MTRLTEHVELECQAVALLLVLVVAELALVVAAVLHLGVRDPEDPDVGAVLVDGAEALVLRVEDLADRQDLQVGAPDPGDLRGNRDRSGLVFL